MDMFEAKKKSTEELAESVCKALTARGFTAQSVKNKGEALEAALKLIPAGASVGVPGTVTVREVGLITELEKRGSKVAVHWDPNLKKEDKPARFIEELTSDWLVTSVNAVTMDGVLVNIDGHGNRVGAMAWAPGKLLMIVGKNKITRDIQSALRRVRDVATPPNVLRLDGSTPCAKVGRCVDCNSPDCSCRVVMMMERAPMGRECHVIIVEEELGY
ncbi:MAG: lactate utilization protein [Synergistaceae bacterium]|nr:lactate utilization protein [Synergistaceae bacterium]